MKLEIRARGRPLRDADGGHGAGGVGGLSGQGDAAGHARRSGGHGLETA